MSLEDLKEHLGTIIKQQIDCEETKTIVKNIHDTIILYPNTFSRQRLLTEVSKRNISFGFILIAQFYLQQEIEKQENPSILDEIKAMLLDCLPQEDDIEKLRRDLRCIKIANRCLYKSSDFSELSAENTYHMLQLGCELEKKLLTKIISAYPANIDDTLLNLDLFKRKLKSPMSEGALRGLNWDILQARLGRELEPLSPWFHGEKRIKQVNFLLKIREILVLKEEWDPNLKKSILAGAVHLIHGQIVEPRSTVRPAIENMLGDNLNITSDQKRILLFRTLKFILHILIEEKQKYFRKDNLLEMTQAEFLEWLVLFQERNAELILECFRLKLEISDIETIEPDDSLLFERAREISEAATSAEEQSDQAADSCEVLRTPLATQGFFRQLAKKAGEFLKELVNDSDAETQHDGPNP